MTREEIRKKWQEEQSVGSNAYKTALEKAKPELEKTRKRIQDKKIREAQVAVSGKVPTPSVYTKNAFANTYNAPNTVVPKQTEIQQRVNKKFYETIAKTNYEQDKIETANRAFQKSQGIHTSVTDTKYDVKDKEKRDAELNQQDLDKLSVMTRKQRLDALGGRTEGTFQKAELYSQEQKNKWLEQRVNEEKGLAKLGGAMVYAGNEFATNTLSSMGQIGATAEYIQGRDSKRKGLQYAQDYAEMTSKIGQNVENKYIQALGMATEGVGQQMPQILLGASGAGALVGGVSEFSNTFNEMILENPENKEKAFLTGVLKGTASGLLENAMGLFGKSKLDDLAVSDIAQIKNWAKRNATAVAYDIGSEITEETLENMVGYVIDAIVNNKNLTMEQLIAETEATFKQTGLTTLLMSMLGIGGNTRTDVNNLNTRYNWIDQANVTGTQKTELKDFAKNSETTNEDLYRKTIKMEQENAVNESIYGDIVNEARLAQNQGSTMQNKTFLEKDRQTVLTDEELANKQFSSEFERSAYKYGINLENESVKQVKKLTDISNNELIFDDTGFKPGQVAKYLDGKVIVNPNADPDKVIQNVVLHEVIHSKSGSKEFNDLKKTVLSFVKSKKGEYKKARLDLDNLYREAYKDRLDFDQLMDEEVITNTLGEYFGTEEKLNELINYIDDRTTLQKFYDFVKDILNRLTGYKDQEQYFRRVERQLAKALQSDYVSKSDDRYLFTGRNSRLENSKSFKEAEQMWKNGVSDLEILEKTGWFYDKEDGHGKWKYEIDDSKSKLLLNESLYKLLDKSKQGLTLKDVFDNEELFKAYPELADYKVVLEKNEDSSTLGSFNSEEKKITLNLAEYNYKETRGYLESMLKNKKDFELFYENEAEQKWQEYKDQYDKLDDTQSNFVIKTTLIHEIQHAIQDIEGFSRGSNPREWQIRKVDVLKALDDRYQYTTKIKDTLYEKYNKRHQELQNKYENKEITLDEYIEDSRKIEKELKEDTDYQGWRTKVNEQLTVLRRIDDAWEYDLYTHTKGEQDARKSADRTNMTLEERRKNLPTKNKDYFKDYDYSVPSPKDILGIERTESLEIKEKKEYNKYHTKTLDEKVRLRSGSRLKKNILAYDNGNYYLINNINYGNYVITDVLTPKNKEEAHKIERKLKNWEDSYGIESNGEIINEMPKIPSSRNGNFKNDLPNTMGEQSWTGFVDSILDEFERINGRRYIVESTTNKTRNKGLEESSSFNLQKNKEKQLEIIQKNNPLDESLGNHTWITSVDDIKTYKEALEYDEYEGGSLTPDFKEEDLNKALETGEMTVYSSYPIEQGIFVTPSKMEAQNYAGSGRVYSKKIKLSDVAWIDTLQGQYAKVEDTKVVKDNKGRTLTKEQQDYFKDSKVRDENGNLLEVYHGTESDFTVFNKDFIGYNGSQYGKGFYYSSRPEVAKQYEKGQGKTLKGYLKIDNPLSMVEKTMSLDTFTDLVHRINEQTNGMFYKKLQDKFSLSSTKQTISLEEWQQLVKEFGKDNYISIWSNETKADKGTTQIYNTNSNDFDVYRSLINSLSTEESRKFIKEIQNRFSDKGNVEENIKELYESFNYDNEILIRFDKYSAEMREEYQFDVYKTIEDMGYDGLISPDMFITFNSNQFKNVDNKKPTTNPDIRYSISQDNKKNIEAKIDRYTRLIEEMQQEGRDSDDWAPYANEILRLQDQLEDTRYSYQSNGAWNDFVKKYFTSEGTKTTLKDIRLPEKKITKKDFTTLVDNAQNIPETDKKSLKEELQGANLTQESLKEFEQVVSEMDKAYKEQNDKILDTNKTAEEMDKIYKKYNRKHSRYDRSSLQNAKQIVPANKSGRRTKQQWLNVAKQIGTEIANKSNEEIEKIAYRTWQEERPNNRESLNRQGESFVNFESYEWVDTIYNAVKEQRAKLSIDTNKMLEQQPKKALPERKIVDEVYTEEIAEGKTRKHYQSVFESDQVGETGKEVAKELYKKDTYVPISNLDTITKTNDNIARMGVENAYIGFTNKIHSNERITLQDIAMGERLIQIYSENGDYDKVNELIQDVAILGTELGQQVQAMSLIKKASPEGQLQYLNKLLERVNIRENTDIKITKQQTEKILKSKDSKDLENNVSQVAIEIAQQIPLKLSDKIRAWRFLSMLGNPKTHIKNLGANLAMNLTQNLKNKVGGALEAIVNVFNPNMERTKTLKFSNKYQRQFAKQDADEMIGQLGAGGKYDIKNIIEQNKRQFDSKVLDAIAKFNSDLLESEDTLFLKIAYQQAMSNYMTANNLKSSDMQGEVLEKARQYATLQANEATFHEANAVASLINRLEQQNALTDVVVSGILPFKKTPMNIAKAGFEYSPAGLIKALGYDIGYAINKTNDYKQQLAEGKISEQQYKTETSKMLNKTIDNMAKGLTGSSITAIGMYLAFKGILKAGNDDEGDEFEEKRGSQEYAITLGDHSYTLDWVSPTAIPLFVGATIYQLATSESEDKQTALNSMFTGLSKSFEPMTEMSMLQGLTSAITSYESGSSNMLFDLGASVVTSYAGQFLPTAMGQVARTIDPYERDTSTTKKGIEGKVDRFVRQSANKIPGVSKMLPTKADVWGEEVKRDDNWLKRYAENAILPWSRKEITQDRTDKELLSVFDQTGEKTLPGVPSKDITLNSTKYRMTTEEYNQAKKDFGQTSKGIFDDLVTTKEYQGLTPEGKAKAISDVYSYAKEKIKVDYAEQQGEEYKPSSLYNTVSELEEKNGDVSAYFDFKGKLDDLDRAKGDEKVKQKEKLEYLNSMKTTDKTKTIIYKDTFGADDEVFSNLQTLTGNRISINDYLDYKTANIEGVDDPNSLIKGKKIPGSAEKNVIKFLKDTNFSNIERMYIRGINNSLDTEEVEMFKDYVTKLNLTSDEKKAIYKKLKNYEEREDGAYRLK